MKRRDFFKTVAGGMIGTIFYNNKIQAAIDTPTVGNKLQLKKAVKFSMIDEDLSIEGKFRLLKSLGFDGVEMSSPNTLAQQEVIRASENVKLPIHGVIDSVHWKKTLSDPDPLVRAEGLEALRTAMYDAHAYGASTVLLVPAVVNKQASYDEAYRRSQAEIKKILPLAAELGVKIAIENVWNKFLLSPMEEARYIDEFESEWIGAYLDIGNTLTNGWPEQWIRILGDRILKLDIKDRTLKKYDYRGQATLTKIGEGDCDWNSVQEALQEIGYNGWGTAEVKGGDRKRLAEIARNMDRSLPF